jgi:hypothetical protein
VHPVTAPTLLQPVLSGGGDLIVKTPVCRLGGSSGWHQKRAFPRGGTGVGLPPSTTASMMMAIVEDNSKLQ